MEGFICRGQVTIATIAKFCPLDIRRMSIGLHLVGEVTSPHYPSNVRATANKDNR
jgi:hypothetical protein